MKVFINENLEAIGLIELARSSSSTSCNEKFIKELIIEGEDINSQDEIGSTALIESTKKGNTAFRVLCDMGADVNIQDSEGLSSLMFASGKQIKILLDLGANINAQTKDGNNALMFAVLRGDIKSIKILVKNKININTKNKRGSTALTQAAAKLLEYGYSTKIIEYLVKSGAERNIIDKRGLSAWTYAVLAENKDMMNLLKWVD